MGIYIRQGDCNGTHLPHILIIIFFRTGICKCVCVCLLEVIKQQGKADRLGFEQLSSPLPAAILHRR